MNAVIEHGTPTCGRSRQGRRCRPASAEARQSGGDYARGGLSIEHLYGTLRGDKMIHSLCTSVNKQCIGRPEGICCSQVCPLVAHSVYLSHSHRHGTTMNLFSLMERSSEHFGTIEIPQPKKLGVLQFNPDRQSPSANVRFLVRRLADISNALIVLPEFFLTHYSYGALFNFSRVELETILLPLTKLAETNSVSLVGSMPVDKFGRSSNEALMISGGGIHHLYNKQRLFGDEWDRFSPGMEPCRMVSAGGLLTKVQVCFDLTVPLNSGPAVDADLDILLIPSAVSIDYLHHIARSRAIEGQCIAAICNRSGTERSGTQ